MIVIKYFLSKESEIEIQKAKDIIIMINLDRITVQVLIIYLVWMSQAITTIITLRVERRRELQMEVKELKNDIFNCVFIYNYLINISIT